MFVSKKHGICFLHIPKYGGSSIRDQLKAIDDLNNQFHGLTVIDGERHQKAHLPLFVVQENFPSEFEMIKPLEKIAIIRDLFGRFLSAFSQRAREVHGRVVGDLSASETRDDFGRGAEYKSARPDLPAYEFHHFMRQVSMTDLNGKQFVETLVPMAQIPDLTAYLSRRTGVKLVRGYHSNKTVSFKQQSTAQALLKAKDWSKQMLPLPAYHKLKELGLALFAEQGFPARTRSHLEEVGLSDFVRTHFAKDTELFEEASGEHNLRLYSNAD